jgi:hypothetical protein
MLPSIHAMFAPQATPAAGLSAAVARRNRSIVKSSAPTSTGGPGSALGGGSSTRIFTRSMSPTPFPKKRSERPAPPPPPAP